MTSKSLFEAPEIDSLLVLCEEVMRATPESAQRFIEPAPGVLARTKSRQHNIIFGRRGSGKSSLLRKAAADLTVDRRPIAYVDMQTFQGHTYPDVLISVLIKSLLEFKGWLNSAATAPANKKAFWHKLFGTTPKRPPFKKAPTQQLADKLDKMINDLEEQLRAPEDADTEVKKVQSFELKNTSELGAGVGVSGISAKVGISNEVDQKNATEKNVKYISHKIGYLHQNIMKFQDFFRELSVVSDGPAYLIMDDLYYIRRGDQAQVIDYFHRVAKSNNVWLKIGTIKHRSEWYKHSEPPIGIKLGDDAREINIDISLEQFATIKNFLTRILTNLMTETPPLTIRKIMNVSAIDRLVLASGGVTRDFIGIFSYAITQAKNRGSSHHRGPKIGAEDVNLATGDYDPIKREEFKVDTDSDRDDLEAAFRHLVGFCTEKSKCNIFLVSHKLRGPTRDAIDQLIDLRLIHPVKSRVTLKRGAEGEVYEAFMLDLSQYTAARKVHQFQIVELTDNANDETIRKASLVYNGP